MPLVDLAKRHFAASVVGFDAFDDLHHRLLPLFSRRLFGRAFLPGDTLVGREANPSLWGRQVAILDLQRDLSYLACLLHPTP
jgi:hypothetical protein